MKARATASSSGLLLILSGATLPEPEPDRDNNYRRRDGAGDLAGLNEILLKQVPVVARPEREERNEAVPDRRRARDREDHAESRQLQRAGERRDDRADAGEEPADEQPANPYFLYSV